MSVRFGKTCGALILGYRGHGRRYGIIPFGNGYTLRAGNVAVHVWRVATDNAAPSLIRRLTLCKLSLCETFKTNSDEHSIWGECQKCGRCVGIVDRRSLRNIGDCELARHREQSRG